MNKQQLRKAMKQKRLSLDKNERALMDKRITESLLELTEIYDTVLCYVSSEIEVDTRAFLQHLFDKGKKTVLVPRCITGTNIMHFYQINSFDDLEKGNFGIEEPKKGLLKVNEYLGKSCCIVPALCYDRRGFRVGFGKGFYDRFLADFEGVKIGICYDCCLVEKIENDLTDICADIVVTDKNISYT